MFEGQIGEFLGDKYTDDALFLNKESTRSFGGLCIGEIACPLPGASVLKKTYLA